MSLAAAHESKDARRLCESCRDRKARFSYRGAVRADRDHTLCFECFRAERDRQRARRLARIPSAAPLRSPFERSPMPGAGERVSLSVRQMAHRKAMLEHLKRSAG